MSEFVTLPSDASFSDFPKNTNSNFTVRLARYVDFTEGQWEVALKDISFLNNWPNVVEGIISITKAELNGRFRRFDIKIGNGRYEDIDEVIQRTHDVLKPFNLHPTIEFEYDKISNKSMLYVRDSSVQVSFSQDFANILGLDPKITYNVGKHGNITSPDINYGFTSLYVYSSIVSNRLVGDANVRLLRVVPVSGKKFSRVYTEFSQAHYVEVDKISTDVIETLITSDDGEKVPFDGGKVILTVHFRKKQ